MERITRMAISVVYTDGGLEVTSSATREGHEETISTGKVSTHHVSVTMFPPDSGEQSVADFVARVQAFVLDRCFDEPDPYLLQHRLDTETTYDVRWERTHDGVLDKIAEVHECHALTLRQAAARLMEAIRTSGPVLVHSMRRVTVGIDTEPYRLHHDTVTVEPEVEHEPEPTFVGQIIPGPIDDA